SLPSESVHELCNKRARRERHALRRAPSLWLGALYFQDREPKLICQDTKESARPDGEVAQEGALGVAMPGFHRCQQFQQVPAAEFECVFVWLVRRAHRVVDKWRGRLLDVAAHDVRYRPGRGELYETACAIQICREIGNVKAARVEVVAGMQDSR